MAADISGGAPVPPPTSNESQYLAALLDEIRLLRRELATARPAAPPAGELELREPELREPAPDDKPAHRPSRRQRS